MSILKLISSDGFISVNKTLIKKLGLEHAVIIGELSSEYEYYRSREQLTQDGYFFSTMKNIEEKTTIKEKRQRAVINDLEKLGLINTVKRGLPSKRYIKLNENSILNILSSPNKNGQNGGTVSVKMDEQDTSLEATNNNIINNNLINNKYNTVHQDELENEFEKVWSFYPRKVKKDDSLKSFIKAVKKDGLEKVVNGTLAFCKVQQLNNKDKKFIMHATTFWNQRVYLDDMNEHLEKNKSNSSVQIFNPWEDDNNAHGTSETIVFDNSKQLPAAVKQIRFEDVF